MNTERGEQRAEHDEQLGHCDDYEVRVLVFEGVGSDSHHQICEKGTHRSGVGIVGLMGQVKINVPALLTI